MMIYTIPDELTTRQVLGIAKAVRATTGLSFFDVLRQYNDDMEAYELLFRAAVTSNWFDGVKNADKALDSMSLSDLMTIGQQIMDAYIEARTAAIPDPN